VLVHFELGYLSGYLGCGVMFKFVVNEVIFFLSDFVKLDFGDLDMKFYSPFDLLQTTVFKLAYEF
jgi:hypothetical protein